MQSLRRAVSASARRRNFVRSAAVLAQQQPRRNMLSTAAAPSPDAGAGQVEPKTYEFESEKVKDLFERITSTCTVDEFGLVCDRVGDILARPLQEREFYFHGFGGGGGKSGGAGGGAAEEAAVAEVKTAFDVKLVGFDAKKKIKVIKEVRSLAGLGLKEAKELVEGAPCFVMKNIKTEAAEEMKAKLIEIGAEIELV